MASPMNKNFTKSFLIILVVSVIFLAYLIFRPFLIEMFVAAILVTVFYTPFEALTRTLKGRKALSAILMCLILVLIIIIPSVKLLSFAGQKSTTLYSSTVAFFEENQASDVFKNEIFVSGPLSFLSLDKLNLGGEAFQGVVLDVSKRISNSFISGAGMVLKETSKFLISLALIILTMFFFFVDGPKMLKRLMYLSPLPNKYDQIIFNKFKKVSYTIFVSTFAATFAQGVVGAIGFGIVGFPPLLAGLLVGVLSLLPYIGSMIFYVPVSLFYIITGDVWQGVFVLLWGFLIIGTVDNFVRSYMIKDDAEVNQVFVLFSILGGMSLFGFWGLIVGPLIIALMVTVFHIYELEFCHVLDSQDCADARRDSSIILHKEKTTLEIKEEAKDKKKGEKESVEGDKAGDKKKKK